MQGTYLMLRAEKAFNVSLFNEYDVSGRHVVIKFLSQWWKCQIEENPDEFGVDLLIKRDNTIVGYVEVEVRPIWNQNNFPFTTINIPYRKKKFFTLDLPTYYCILNKSLDKYLFITSDEIVNSPVTENKNKYVSTDEYFYNVNTFNVKYKGDIK